MALTDKLSAIGDAIREKTGKSELLTLDQMPTEIQNIEGSGSGGDIHEWEDWRLTEGSALDLYENSRITKLGEYGLAGVRINTTNLPNVSTVKNGAFRGASCYIVNLPKATTFLDSVFRSSSLQSLYAPELTYVGANCFDNCLDIGLFTDEDGNEKQVIDFFSNLTEAGGEAFNGCNRVEEFNFPKLKKIGQLCFANNTNAIKYVLPELETVANQVFKYNSALEEIHLPKVIKLSLTEFYGCRALKKVKLDLMNSISSTSKYNSPFYSCSNIETLILGYDGVVNSTINVKDLFDTSSPLAKGTGYIYVPSAHIEEYKTATNWVSMAEQFRAIEDYPDICG